MNLTGFARKARAFVGRGFAKGSASNVFSRAAKMKTVLNTKVDSTFKKAATAARQTFTASASMKQDIGVRAINKVGRNRVVRGIGREIKAFAYDTPGEILTGTGKIGKRIYNKAGAMGPIGLLSVGATAMMGVGIMRGANNASREYVLERYMADQRFSRDILLQSRVGLSMGTNKMNRMGSTMGLSNALSKTRHGASY